MPRLFTGLELPSNASLDLQIMQGGIPGARWLEPANFHLTLRFVGDIEVHQARDLAMALDSITFRPFRLRLKGVGLFGGNKPHSLFTGVEESADLQRLHDLHERVCRQIGLPPETRRFIPHVSLARLREPDMRALQRWVEVHSLYSTPTFDVHQFVLFSSRPLKGGGPYAVEETYQLMPEFGMTMGA